MPVPTKVFSRLSIESLANALREGTTAALKEKLKADGLDLDRPFPVTVPAEQFVRWIEVTAASFFPGLGRDEAHRELGKRIISGWQRTLVGSATAALISLIGTRTAVRRVEDYFRPGANFVQVKVEEVGPRFFEVVFADVVGVPGYYAGLLYAGAALTRPKNLSVTYALNSLAGAKFELRWGE